jgi:predicted esterase
MKSILSSLILCFSLSIYAQEFSLEIVGGYMEGDLVKGDSVFVWSRTFEVNGMYPPFSHWSGTAANYLTKVDEWRSVLKIPVSEPENSFTLYANWKFPNISSTGSYIVNQWGEENENGLFFPVDKVVHYALPPEPKAIVFMIHGTGGRSESWFTNFEKYSLVNDLVAEDYAVFALNSNETTLGDQDGDGKVRWENSFFKQDTLTNIDFKNVLHTKKYIDVNLDFGDIPVFIIGGSNGANFADYCTAVLDFEASAHMTGNGNTTFFDNYPDLKPVIWIQSRNDNNASANDSIAWANHQKLIAKNIKTEWHWLEKSPAYPQRFERSNNNINEYFSSSIYDSLELYGLIDETGFLTIDNVNDELPENFYNFSFLNTSQTNDYIYQLNVLNADHIATGDFNKTIIRFFDDCIAQSTNTQDLSDIANAFNIRPNPAYNSFEISHSFNQPCRFQLIDISGNVHIERVILESTEMIDIEHLASGIYFTRIILENKSLVKKLVKK